MTVFSVFHKCTLFIYTILITTNLSKGLLFTTTAPDPLDINIRQTRGESVLLRVRSWRDLLSSGGPLCSPQLLREIMDEEQKNVVQISHGYTTQQLSQKMWLLSTIYRTGQNNIFVDIRLGCRKLSKQTKTKK